MAQINLGGSVGVPGSVSVLGSYNVIFATDANHTMSSTEYSNKFLSVTGTISTTRNLIAPLNQGQEFVVQNNTTGGHNIVINGITGAGVSIANGATASVVCDGANYIQAGVNAVSLQGYPVSATAPTTSYVLTWNGATWQPAAGGGGGSFTPGEDLSGNSTSQEVIGILGNLLPAVSGGSPSLGNGFLNWSGSAWQYSNVSPYVTMTGDVTGFANTNGVSSAQGGLIVFNPSLSTPNVGGIEFFHTVIGPKIFQGTITSDSVNANPMYISAQSASGLNSNGGNLLLTSGSGGTGIGVAGTIALQIAGSTKLNIGNTGTITLAPLAGFGTGLVATDNSGNLSWTSSVTWAGDLVGSTNTAQYISSISGNANSLANVPINAISLLFIDTITGTAALGQSNYPDISSGTGVDGATLAVGAQAGQNTTDIAGFGGTGGNINMSAGNGGTGGAGDGSPGRAAIISGSSHIYLNNNGVEVNTGMTLQSVSTSSTTYTIDSGVTKDYYVMCDTSFNAITLTLPTATNGRTLVIKDIGGNAATHNITINRVSSQKIDGATSYVLNLNYASIVLSGSGAESVNWFVVGSYNGTII